jgi:AcrR family transcriptional regulator
MAHEAITNKQGQILGRKGQETRQRLMAAARKLLCSSSPVDLTAVAIAKAAGTSSASFYMYFDDVQDVLYSLSQLAGTEMTEVAKLLDAPWTFETLERETIELIEALNSVWSRHREVLRYRNLEADRGDPRFEELRMNTYIPFIERFARRILSLNPATGSRRKSDAYAEATVLHAAMERLAATDPMVVEKGLGSHKLVSALARIIIQTLRSGGDNLAQPSKPEEIDTAALLEKSAPAGASKVNAPIS